MVLLIWLGDDIRDGKARGVRLYEDGLAGVELLKDWCLSEDMLTELKTLFCFLCSEEFADIFS